MNNLNFLLNILADKEDVAIISMAGAYRTGKSFMLNIFLRYLRKKGWQNKNWFGPEDENLLDGFHWKRGVMGLTKGMNVWPEIFDVPLENGKRMISVIIVDTQGLFDCDSTEDTSHKIMMLSTLLSSHQIYNCRTNLEQRDLEFFHTSVKFAKAISQKLQKQEGHPFQALTFLVRDWHFDYEYPFGDNGGCELVGSILKDIPTNLPETVKEVEESIAIAFENVCGFLMPPPGKEVRGNLQSSDITIADIKGEFRYYACQLAEKILHPKNLVAKQICRKPMSTNTCVGLIAEISKAFDLPSVDGTIDFYEKAEDVANLIKAVEMYEQQMNEHISKLGNIFSEKDEVVCHENSLQEVKKVFSQNTATGFEEESEIWKLIKEDCENYSNSVLEENKEKRRQIEQVIVKISAELEKLYEQNINNLNISAMSEKHLEAQLTEYRKEAEQKYNKQTEPWKDILPDFIDKMLQMLINKLTEHPVRSKEKRKIEESSMKLVQEKLTSEYREITQAACKEYERKMEECPSEGPVGKDKLSQHHENCKTWAQRIFEDKVKTMKTHPEHQVVEKFRLELNKIIQDKNINYLKKTDEMHPATQQREKREEFEKDISDKWKNTHLSERVEVDQSNIVNNVVFNKRLNEEISNGQGHSIAYFQISKGKTASQSQQRCSDDEIIPTDVTKPFSEQTGTLENSLSTYDKTTCDISEGKTVFQSQQRCSDEINPADATKPFSEQIGKFEENISAFSERTAYENKAEVEYDSSALQEYNVESAIEPYAFRVEKKGCRVIAPYCKLLFPPNAVERAIDITMSVMYYSEEERDYAFITPHVTFTSRSKMTFLRDVQVSLYTSYSSVDVRDPVYVKILKTSKSEDDVILTQVCLTDERFIVFGCRSFCRFCACVRVRDRRLLQRRFYSAAYIRNERTKQSRVVHWSIYEDMPDTRQDKLKHLEKKSIFFDPQCFTLRCHHDLQFKLKMDTSDVTVRPDDKNIQLSHLFTKKVDTTTQFVANLSEGVTLCDANLEFQTEIVAIDGDTNATILIDRNFCFMIWNDDKCSPADQHTYHIEVGENGIGVKNDFTAVGSSVDP